MAAVEAELVDAAAIPLRVSLTNLDPKFFHLPSIFSSQFIVASFQCLVLPFQQIVVPAVKNLYRELLEIILCDKPGMLGLQNLSILISYTRPYRI